MNAHLDKHKICVLFAAFILLLITTRVYPQNIDDNLLTCNQPVPFVNRGAFTTSVVGGNMPGHVAVFNIQPWTGAFGVNLGTVGNSGNVTDAVTTNAATMSYLLSVSGGLRLTVQIGNGVVPAGYYAGFAISNSGILNVQVLGLFTIKTYLNNTLQESVSSGSGAIAAGLVNNDGINRLGFVTTLPFNRIMIEQNQTVAGLSVAVTNIYYPILEKFCAETFPIPCNKVEYWTNPDFPVYVNQAKSGLPAGLVCANCNISNIQHLVDADRDNYAEIDILAAIGATASVSVKNTKTIYGAGTFAGYEIDDMRTLGVQIGTQHQVATLLGGVEQEVVTAGSGLVSGSIFTTSGRTITGFKTTLPFDEIRLTVINNVAVGNAPVRVYSAVVKRFCEGDAFTCNTNVILTEPDYPVYVDARNTGINAVACVNCTITGGNHPIDDDPGNYAEVVIPAGVGTTAAYAIANGLGLFNSDPQKILFAGFDMDNPSLVNANTLSGVSVVTTLNGIAQQTINSSNGLVSIRSALLNGSARQTVGFIPSMPFDGLKIIFSSVINANIGTTRIYGAVIKEFCENELSCNTLTAITNPVFPVYVNGARTQIDATACVGCGINNAENIVNEGTADPATLVMRASVGALATVAVANALETYPAGSFAGFEISSATLFSANVVARTVITLYNNGVEVQSGGAQALLAGAGSSLLTGGGNRHIVGVIGHVPFDEVQLVIENLAGVNLDIIEIYKPYIQRSCIVDVDCSTNGLLTTDAHGAVINAANTGVEGGVCAGCVVNGPWDAVSASTTDYARLVNTAGALQATSLSVASTSLTFPAGAFAGFSVRKNNFIIAASLFEHLTITTYNNGVVQESRSGNGLIDLAVLLQLLGTGEEVFIPGFYTSMPFDEIKITTGSLLAALDQYIDVYGAYVDVRTYTVGLGFNCNVSKPDINAGIVHKVIEGNVSVNDRVVPGTTYSNDVSFPAGYTNPSGAVPVVSADGTYTFTTSEPGVYQFEIAVCAPDENSSCKKELLTITIIDSSHYTVPNPVANTDIAVVQRGGTVVINSLANDKASIGYSLNPGSATLADMNGAGPGNTSAGGTATINLVTGYVTYQAPAGFIGTDTIKYTICDNQPVPVCAWAYQVITILPPGVTNTTLAADDYNITNVNVPVSVSAATGLLSNDIDPEGHQLKVTEKDTVIAGRGQLVVVEDGSYSFIPVPGFEGTVVFHYQVTDDGAIPATAWATLYIVVKYAPSITMPDINVTTINVPVEGNVNTNDVPGVFTLTYGVPVPKEAYPGTSITMNNNGTYSFTASVPGIYHYYVPVCTGTEAASCTMELLTITVLDPEISNTNPPVANTDIASVITGQSVMINTLANDRAIGAGIELNKSSVVVNDLNGEMGGNTYYGGTATVNPTTGTITYTPAPGFIGRDTIQYTVCDNHPIPLCATAYQVIDVYPLNTVNSVRAADDYVTVPKNAQAISNVTNGVLANDIDPEGNSISAIAKDTTIAGKGRLQLQANGSYVFTPVTGFVGTVVIPYTAIDNGVPQARSVATLYILVKEVPDLTPVLTISPSTIAGTTNINVVVTINEINNTYTAGAITVYLVKHRLISLTFNPVDAVINGIPVSNSAWTIDATSNPNYYILTTNAVINGGGSLSVGLTGVLTPGATNGRINMTTVILPASGREENSFNNNHSVPINFTQH